jgi:hypothetical protein
MSYETLASQRNTVFSALDPDLPFLTARVAIHVDKLLAGTLKNRDQMILLSKKLSSSLSFEESEGTQHSLMDFATRTILGGALTETYGLQSTEKIEDLFLNAQEIAEVLEKGNPAKDREKLEQAGTFCVLLSRAAAAYSESIHDLRPTHPFRR